MRRVDHRRRQREGEQRLDEVRERRIDLARSRERLVERRSITESRLEKALRLRDQLQRRLVRAERLQVAGRLHERVVADARHRRVAAPAVNAHLEGRRHLLGGRAQIDRRAAEHEPLAASLVDRVVAARRVRVCLDEPAEPVVRADLLVRDDEKDEVAGRDEALSRASDANATALAATWSFMSSAPRPQTSPSTRSPDHGSRSHSAGSARTVSVWERNASDGPSPPSIRATRLARCGSRA